LARIERRAAYVGELRERESELVALNAAKAEQITVLTAKVEALTVLVAELSAKLGRSSQNSSKPPSSDGPGTRAERRKVERAKRRSEPAEGPRTPKKLGGQPGHEGSGLAFTPSPNARVTLNPPGCDGCGAGLDDAASLGSTWLQVTDIPEVRALVTEYLLVAKRCACGCVTKAEPPAGMPAAAGTCYGPNLTAAALLCHAFGQLGQERTAEVVNGLFATEVPQGWINNIAQRLGDNLHGFEADLKTSLLTEPVALADETPVNTMA
jgi:transposase